MRKVLSRQEVIDAVERRGCKNPPAFLHKFWGMGSVSYTHLTLPTT